MTRAPALLLPLALIAVAALLVQSGPRQRPGNSARGDARTTAGRPDAAGSPGAEFPGRAFAGPAAGSPGAEIAAVAEGGGRVEADADAPPGEGALAIELRAVDATTGEAVADVVILFQLGAARREARTDELGRSAVAWPPPAGDVLVRLRSEGHAERSLLVKPPIELTVELFPVGRLDGVVVDAVTGRAVAGARLAALDTDERARADDVGRFVLERFVLGRPASVEVTAAGYATQKVSLGGAAGEDAVLELLPARRLFGRVQDWSTRAPVPGVRVEAPVGATATDDHGIFDLEVLPGEGPLSVELEREGYCSATAALEPSERESVVRLPRAASIEGSVRHADGQPAAGAVVARAAAIAVWAGGRVVPHAEVSESAQLGGLELRRPAGAPARAQTDANGRFRLDGVLPGTRKLALEVRAGDARDTYLVDLRADPGEVVELELFPGCPEEQAARATRQEVQRWFR